MRKLLIVGITFLLGFSQLASTLVFFNFKLNQDYISEFLCLEKDDPNSCCAGKCYLKAELEELSAPDSNKEQHVNLWQDWRWISEFKLQTVEVDEPEKLKQEIYNTPLVISLMTAPPSPPPQVIG